MIKTTQKILIFFVMLSLAIAQIAVPFTIEATHKLVPVSLTIESHFVESDKDQRKIGVFVHVF